MSEILANIVVEQTELNFQPEVNSINVTPEAINLNIFTAGAPGAGQSSNTELLFNNQNLIDGVPFTNYDGNKLTLGNASNIKITGGTNGYVLQTDGTGNLGWTAMTGGGGNGSPGGANTQIQFNDGGLFGGSTGFTFDKSTNVFSTPGNAVIGGNANIGGNVGITNAISAAQGSITTLSGNSFNPNNLTVINDANITGNVTANVATFTNSNLGNLAIANYFSGDGSLLSNINGSNVSNVANANYANFAGNVVNSAQPNITSLGTLTDLRTSNGLIHIGPNAGINSQSTGAIAIGTGAGANSQGVYAIAIGLAGTNNQGNRGIAIGDAAGGTNQGSNAIAMGYQAGGSSQGANSIALGANAGFPVAAIDSITLNATGANLPANDSGFYVKPVRNLSTANVMYYNNSTGEITYDVGSAALISNGTSNVNIPTANDNVTVGINGTANAVVISNNLINAISNISANVFVSRVTTGTAPFSVNSTTQVANLNAATAGTAGTVTTAAQPNITSVGNLTSLTVTGNIGSGNINAGNLLQANFIQGTLTTAAQPNITSVGTLSSIILSANSNITLSGSQSTIQGANLISATNITGTLTTNAQPNITSVGTLGNLTITSNCNAGTFFGSIGTASQTGITTIGPQDNFRTSANVSGVQLNIGAAYALGNINMWDTAPTNLSGNFFITLDSLPNVGSARTTQILTLNGGGNTYRWLPPGSPNGIISAAGTVNYYYKTANTFTGSAKDLYTFTVIRKPDSGLNTVYDLIIEKNDLT